MPVSVLRKLSSNPEAAQSQPGVHHSVVVLRLAGFQWPHHCSPAGSLATPQPLPARRGFAAHQAAERAAARRASGAHLCWSISTCILHDHPGWVTFACSLLLANCSCISACSPVLCTCSPVLCCTGMPLNQFKGSSKALNKWQQHQNHTNPSPIQSCACMHKIGSCGANPHKEPTCCLWFKAPHLVICG